MVRIVALKINLPFPTQAVPQASQISEVRQDFRTRHCTEAQRFQSTIAKDIIATTYAVIEIHLDKVLNAFGRQEGTFCLLNFL